MYYQMFRRIASGVMALGLIALGASSAVAQPANDSDTQDYEVTVEEIFEIAAPFEAVQTDTYDDGNVTFSDQVWEVRSNYAGGAEVTFSAPAFENQSDTDVKRNVSLSVTVDDDPGSVWGTPGADSESVYEGTPADASVAVESTGAGNADIDVTVEMIVGDVNTLAAGDYTTTVTGLLSAN